MQTNIVLVAALLCVGPAIVGSIAGVVLHFVDSYRIVLVRK